MPVLFRADHVGSFLQPQELLAARPVVESNQLRPALHDFARNHIVKAFDSPPQHGAGLLRQSPCSLRSR